MKKKPMKNRRKKTTTRTKKSVTSPTIQKEIDFAIPPTIEEKITVGIEKISEESRYPFTCLEIFQTIDEQIVDLRKQIRTLKALKREKHLGVVRRFLRRLFRRR